MTLLMVGDPNQRIYGYTGASESVMEDMQRWIKDYETYPFPINYRSTLNIVHAANSVMVKNYENPADYIEIIPMPGAEQGDPVKIIPTSTPEHEAEWITTTIKEGSFNHSETIVMARTNAQVGLISDTMKELNLAHTVLGDAWTFWDRKHVKTVLGYLELSEGGGDTTSLENVIGTPSSEMIRKYGPDKGQYVGTRYLSRSNFLSSYPTYDHILHNIDTMSRKIRPGALDIIHAVGMINGAQTLSSKIEYIAGCIKKSCKFTTGFTPSIQEDLDRVMATAAKCKSVGGFLEKVQMLKSISAERKNEHGKLRLGTCHMFKGMEADTVFVTGCCEGIPDSNGMISYGSMPHKYAFVAPEKEGELYEAEMSSMEEERRIFFVAITRAKKTLYCSWYGARGDEMYQPSRFLREMMGVSNVQQEEES